MTDPLRLAVSSFLCCYRRVRVVIRVKRRDPSSEVLVEWKTQEYDDVLVDYCSMVGLHVVTLIIFPYIPSCSPLLKYFAVLSSEKRWSISCSLWRLRMATFACSTKDCIKALPSRMGDRNVCLWIFLVNFLFLYRGFSCHARHSGVA